MICILTTGRHKFTEFFSIFSFFQNRLYIRSPVGSTDKACSYCNFFRVAWKLMERPCFLQNNFPLISAGPQKPQKLTRSKIKHNFKTSWTPKISISIFFYTKTTLILMILLYVCTYEALQKWEGMILKKTRSFFQLSCNSEEVTVWTSLIGWPHKTSIIYVRPFKISIAQSHVLKSKIVE